MRWLGAEAAGGPWRLPVLEDVFQIDAPAGRVITSAGRPVGPHWRILALHYLSIGSRPERREPEITFADLQTARSYADVYRGRTEARLCATAGRDAATLSAAADAIRGRKVSGGDLGFQFDVFPRLSIRLVWYAADEEFPPSATILLPSNIEDYFCAEDIVVLSERLVSRLGGRPF